jgi:hypothetical protein
MWRPAGPAVWDSQRCRMRREHKPFYAYLPVAGHPQQHLTLMESYCAPDPCLLQEMEPFMDATLVVQTKDPIWIPGHDRAGYLILPVENAEVRHRHELLVRAGCVSTWRVFYSHITLLRGLTKSDALGRCGGPKTVTFGPTVTSATGRRVFANPVRKNANSNFLRTNVVPGQLNEDLPTRSF